MRRTILSFAAVTMLTCPHRYSRSTNSGRGCLKTRPDWKIVSVGERPFPAALQGEGFRAEPDPSAVPLPIAGIGGGLILAALAWRRRQRTAAAKAATVAATAQ